MAFNDRSSGSGESLDQKYGEAQQSECGAHDPGRSQSYLGKRRAIWTTSIYFFPLRIFFSDDTNYN